jgi:hypothetical protein
LGAVLGLSVAVHVAFGGTASADAFADCVRSTASAHMVAKVEFQRDLRNLVVQNRPEFEALSDVNMDLQILFAEARRKRFDHLLTHDPDRIDTANGLSRFSNFSWSDEDTKNFMAESESYRKLERRISQLEDQNNAHPDWPELREYFRAELTRSPEFSGVMARFQDRQSDVEARITQCRRN